MEQSRVNKGEVKGEIERVFDASALMAFLQDEPEAKEVEELIERTGKANQAKLICVIHLGEVWYNVARRRLDADQIINRLLSLDFTIVNVDWELTHQASKLKYKFKLGFGDCYAAALAQLRGAELVTRDTDFKKLEREVKVRLLKGK